MVDWDSHDESPKHITSANVTDDDVEAFYRHRKRMKRQAEIAAQEAAEAAANAPPVDPRKQELVDLMKTVHTNMQTQGCARAHVMNLLVGAKTARQRLASRQSLEFPQEPCPIRWLAFSSTLLKQRLAHLLLCFRAAAAALRGRTRAPRGRGAAGPGSE